MSAGRPTTLTRWLPWLSAVDTRFLSIAAVAAVAFVVIAVLAPQAIFRAFLVGWLLFLSGGVGAAVLIHIHRLTGGEWGERTMPVLRILSACVPLMALLGLVPLLAQPFIYEWADGTTLGERPLVGTLYLNVWSFGARGLAILIGWSIMALIASGDRFGGSRLVSALLLAFYGLSVNFASFDWLMSLEPEWTSTTFGAFFALIQLCTALAVLAVSDAAGPGRPRDDIAKLLLATLLGVIYMVFTQYLVQWSGNLPEKVAFFVDRSEAPWSVVMIVSFVIGGIVPFAILSRSALRHRAGPVAIAGSSILAALVLQFVWWSGPALGGVLASILAVVFLVAAVGGLVLVAGLAHSGSKGRS